MPGVDLSAMPRVGLTHTTLTERVYTELRAAIATGILKPGATISAVELAQSMSVSRTPVGHAIARLQAEGLVVPGSRTSFIVPKLSAKEMVDLHEARLACHLYAVWSSLPHLTDAHVDHIRRELEGYPNVSLDEVVRRRGSGIGMLLMNLIDNELLKRWYEELEAREQPYRLMVHERMTDERRQSIRLDHEEIVAALDLRDWRRMEEALRAHSRRNAANMIAVASSVAELQPIERE